MSDEKKSQTRQSTDQERELRRRYEESLRKWEKMTRDQREAIRTSEQLSEADLAVRINALD